MAEKTEFGLFDIKKVEWLWKGSEEELLEILNAENKDKEKLVNTTFKGHRLFKEEELTENTPYKSFMFLAPARLLYSEYVSLSYATKPVDFYKIEGQSLINQDMFSILSKSGLFKANRFKKPKYVPQARNGPVANSGLHYKFGNYYRNPQQSGMLLELSRYKEDKEYVPTLTKQGSTPNVWDESPRHLDRSWKNNKLKHQWQKHIR